MARFDNTEDTLDQEMIDRVRSFTPDQRAFLLSECFDREDMQATVQAIKAVGFDANQLAVRAIKNNHEVLFDLALANGADCCAYALEDSGKTLLQNLISQNNEKFISKILSKANLNLDSTLLNILHQEDIQALEYLFKYDKTIIQKLIHGYNLFHKAIACNKDFAVHKILELDPDVINTTSMYDLNPLEIAIRSGSEEMIGFISSKISMEQELNRLVEKDDGKMLEKILDKKLIDEETKQKLAIHALEKNALVVVKVLKEYGVDFYSIYKQAESNDNYALLDAAILLDSRLADAEERKSIMQDWNLTEAQKFTVELLADTMPPDVPPEGLI